VGFRSFFTVDGVLTTDGFRPTEVNPRFGAGLAYVASAAPELPLVLLHRAAIAGAVDPVAADLEALVLPGADATRAAASWVVVPGPPVEAVEEADLGEGVRVEVGPSAMGRFVRVVFDVDALPAGRPVAPAAAAALMAADARFGLGLGPLEPAVAVR
jgi:hypothetical protein